MKDASTLYRKLLRHHNAGGEWRVEKQRLSWEILDAFAAAAQQAGIPATDDFNRGSNEGVGYFEVNQRKGLRWNATKEALVRASYGTGFRAPSFSELYRPRILGTASSVIKHGPLSFDADLVQQNVPAVAGKLGGREVGQIGHERERDP